MNRPEIEALIARFSNTYPAAAAPQPGTVDEWLNSSLAAVPVDAAFAAFDEWKEVHNWPPQLPEFVRACATELNRRRDDADAAHGECPDCDGDGWKRVDLDDPRSPVIPCATCRPDRFELHAGGQLELSTSTRARRELALTPHGQRAVLDATSHPALPRERD